MALNNEWLAKQLANMLVEFERGDLSAFDFIDQILLMFEDFTENNAT